eukprot:1160095-Pelagomonas_calceolata.AAC.12
MSHAALAMPSSMPASPACVRGRANEGVGSGKYVMEADEAFGDAFLKAGSFLAAGVERVRLFFDGMWVRQARLVCLPGMQFALVRGSAWYAYHASGRLLGRVILANYADIMFPSLFAVFKGISGVHARRQAGSCTE